jgi:hypothetical protein
MVISYPFYSFTTELERTRRYINAGNSLPR